MRDLNVGGEKLRRGKGRAHVTVEVRGMDADGDGALDLGAKFALGFVGLGVRGGDGRWLPKRSGGIEQAGDRVAWRRRCPSDRSSIRW